jgi:steroid delta-isomerase-like uncharacterized protein
MRTVMLLAVLLLLSPPQFATAQTKDSTMQDVTTWYDAFTHKDPSRLDRILAETWVDIPAAPGQPSGPAGAKQLLAELTEAFPDLTITIEDVLRDGDKVVVRSTLHGTQRGRLMEFAASGATLSIQAIDIHQFERGRIVRTWHSEDWLTGLRQLGVLGK